MKKINFNNPTNTNVFIIGEIGNNHNGSISKALKLINISKKYGIDCVKFQTFEPNEMASENLAKANYQKKRSNKNETQFERLKRVQIDKKFHKTVLDECRKININFSSSVFDITSAKLLSSFKPSFIKIPSGEITNLPLLKHLSKINRPLILSTGMSNIDEVKYAVKILNKKRHDLCILHCVSSYPTALSDINLNSIHYLREQFPYPIGFSDHTLGFEASNLAISAGATVIEKHITLDKNLEGGDHLLSLNPKEIKHFVISIRKTEKIMGLKEKNILKTEIEIKKISRKSIFIKNNKKLGSSILKKDIILKRPGTGLSPTFINKVIGKKLSKKIEANTMLLTKHFKI